jgi:hypothetical protein
MWHTGFFVVVNAFLWIQDIVAGEGLEYAYWITIPWGVGLISHALAYLFETRRMKERTAEDAAKDEPRQELQPH